MRNDWKSGPPILQTKQHARDSTVRYERIIPKPCVTSRRPTTTCEFSAK
jgi:hypothetical protein